MEFTTPAKKQVYSAMTASEKKKAKFTPGGNLIQTQVDQYVTWGSKSRAQQAFDFQLTLSMIKCNWSFKEIEKEGFIELIKFMVPQVQIKDESTFRKIKLPLVYENIKDAMRQMLDTELGSGGDISFTADFWKARSLEMYLNVTMHYITHKGKLRNLCIGFTGKQK